MWLDDALKAYGAISAVMAAIKALRAFGESDTLQGNLAYISLKMKQGPHNRSPYPVLIERLDDGSDPLRQDLHLDIAPAFPQGRIDQALRYLPSPYYMDILHAIGEEIERRANSGLSPDEEKDCSVTLVLLREAARATYLFRGRLGGELRLVHKTWKSNWRKELDFAISTQKMRERLRTENQEKRKAMRRTMKIGG